MQQGPPVLGRSTGDAIENAHARSSTVYVGESAVEYVSGATGVARVELFKSTDGEDRGGFVLRVTIIDGGSSFVPTCKALSNGVELHLAGEAEGDALLRALARSFRRSFAAPMVKRGVGGV